MYCFKFCIIRLPFYDPHFSTLLNRVLIIVPAICETKQFMEDIEQMTKAKGQICSQILERQRKIVCLESDSSTLIQVHSICVMRRGEYTYKAVNVQICCNRLIIKIGKRKKNVRQFRTM